jgi:hypothetical protein
MAAVYVTISKQYILPGLDRLSDLTTSSAVAAQVKYEDFQKWEREAVLGISDTILRVSMCTCRPPYFFRSLSQCGNGWIVLFIKAEICADQFSKTAPKRELFAYGGSYHGTGKGGKSHR